MTSSKTNYFGRLSIFIIQTNVGTSKFSGMHVYPEARRVAVFVSLCVCGCRRHDWPLLTAVGMR